MPLNRLDSSLSRFSSRLHDTMVPQYDDISALLVADSDRATRTG